MSATGPDEYNYADLGSPRYSNLDATTKPFNGLLAWTGGFNMEWLITDHWAFKWGVNLISGAKNRHHIATNAYIPLTYGSASIPDAYGYVGHKYKMDVKAAHGIIRENFGAYKDRDEVFFKMDYRF